MLKLEARPEASRFMAIAYGYFRMTAGRRADLATPALLPAAQH